MTDPRIPQHLRGILLMVGAMALFAITDVIIKLASDTITPAHTTVLIVGGGLIIFAALALAERQTLWHRAAFSPVLLIRYLSEIVGTFGIVISLSLVPLPTVGAIIQATPLVGTAGAVLFLKERVSWSQWAAVMLGFVGVLLIVQPGSDGFDLSILWPVVCMLGLAGRDLTTRRIPRGLASSVLSAYSMAAALPVALLWAILTTGQVLPDPLPLGFALSMSLSGAVAYLMMVAAIRSTALSVVAPYRYARLVFLMILGIVMFAEYPGPLVLAGAALIVISGLYAMTHRPA